MSTAPRLAQPVSSTEIAAVLGAEHVGPAVQIVGPAPLDAASPEHVAYAEKDVRGGAGCVIAAAAVEGRTCIVAPDPKLAFVALLERWFPEPRPAGVHPTAVVEGALGADVSVGPHAVIGPGATIGDRCVIGAGAVVGAGCTIGPDSRLFPRAVLYPGVIVGARCRIHSGAVIGADGFSYHPTPRGAVKVPQVGRVRIDDDVEIGANACVDRAFLEETVVGAGSKIDDLVMVGHNSRLGRSCLLAGQAGLSGSVTLGDGVIVAGQAGLADHLTIGSGAKIGAKCGVHNDLEGGQAYLGSPAMPLRQARRVLLSLQHLPGLVRSMRRIEKKLQGLEEV